jgi:hypothetical protein
MPRSLPRYLEEHYRRRAPRDQAPNPGARGCACRLRPWRQQRLFDPSAADAEKTRACFATARSRPHPERRRCVTHREPHRAPPAHDRRHGGHRAACGACDQMFQQRRIVTQSTPFASSTPIAARLDVIKSCTGSRCCQAPPTPTPSCSRGDCPRDLDTATKHGRRVAAHVEGPRTIVVAVRSGAAIEQGAPGSDANTCAPGGDPARPVFAERKHCPERIAGPAVVPPRACRSDRGQLWARSMSLRDFH